MHEKFKKKKIERNGTKIWLKIHWKFLNGKLSPSFGIGIIVNWNFSLILKKIKEKFQFFFLNVEKVGAKKKLKKKCTKMQEKNRGKNWVKMYRKNVKLCFNKKLKKTIANKKKQKMR